MPINEILQHALVTMAALAASAVIFRRIRGVVGTRAKRTACSCPSGDGACGTPGRESAKGTDATVHHVTVLTRQHTARSSAPPA